MKAKNTPAIITNATRRRNMLHSFLLGLPKVGRLDVITGEFEVAAFLHLADVWPHLESVRILVGNTQKPKSKGEVFDRIGLADNRSIEMLKERTDDLKVLEQVKGGLKSGRIEIRAYLREKLNGALYLYTDPTGLRMGYAGSSSFSLDGLSFGTELNTALDQHQCEEMLALFETLFVNSEDLHKEIKTHIDRHTRVFSPYEVYMKSLYEYFKGREISPGVWEKQNSKIFPILSGYQRDAYYQLLRIGELYSGALLCDGVGLGKTFVALMLIERMVQERKRVVVIVPKSTREAVWEACIRRYIPDVRGVFGSLVVVYNHTDLLRGATAERDFVSEFDEIQRHADVIIIDEGHHFRTPSSRRSQKLYELSEGKIVYLLTATPINNTLFDLQHLMEFFTRRNDARFEHLGINSIRGYLIQKERLIAQKMAGEMEEENFQADYDIVEAEQILNDDRLFREVVVQRSRVYVKEREMLADKQTLFPDRQPPQVADYSLKDTYGPLLDDLRNAFDRDDPLLKLSIYYPLAYARRPADSPEQRKEANRQKQIVGLVRTTLLKRFESSWRSFQFSCEDLLLKMFAMVRKLNEKKYEQWRNLNALWLSNIEDHMRDRFDLGKDRDDMEEEDLLSGFADALPDLDPRLYHINRIVSDTLNDMNLIVRFLGRLKGMKPQKDTKLQRLMGLLKTDPLLSRHKVVVFSEYRDTARYLSQALQAAKIRDFQQIDSTSKVDRLEVIRRFAPFYNYEDAAKHAKALASPIRVLISTDILSEGLNLQDAFLLINYDLHWNPVRLMQRIGRVDRRMNPDLEKQLLSARPDEKGLRGRIWFWNFLPPAELSDLLSLYHRVAHKVLKISETTGLEGEKLLTPEDHFNTLKNFNEAYEGMPSTEERMRLHLNRELKDDPDLEAALENLPWRIFSSKASDNGIRGLFACYRFPAAASTKLDDALGELRWYFLPDNGQNVLTSVREIDGYVATTHQVATNTLISPKDRRDRLKLIEKHIKTKDLKKRKAVTMAQVAGSGESDRLQLVAWMDVSSLEEPGSFVSKITTE